MLGRSGWTEKVELRIAKLPYALLVLSLLATVAVCLLTYRSSDARDSERFSGHVQTTNEIIRNTFLSEVDLAKGLSLFISSSKGIDEQEFTSYVRLWNIDNYPGLIGIGYAEAQQAKRGSQPGDTPKVRFKYFEPSGAAARHPIAFELSADPAIGPALKFARDYGSVASSGPITTPEAGQAKTTTMFMLTVPVYRSNVRPESIAARRSALMGFVFCPINGAQFEAKALGTMEEPPVAFKLYNTDQSNDSTALASPLLGKRAYPTAHRFEKQLRIDLENWHWTASVVSTPAFDRISDMSLVWWVALNGMLVSLLVFAVSLLWINLRRRAESATRQLTEYRGELFKEGQRFRALVDGLRDHALFMVGPSGQIRTWNPGVEMVFGYSEQEFLQLHVSALFNSEERANGVPEAEIATAVKQGRAREDGWRVRKDGKPIWIAGGASLLRDEAGLVVGIVKVMRDQTDLKEAEAKVREINAELERRVEERTAQLLEANKDMESFCYTVSHDMRTPLRGIVAASKFVLEDYGNLLPNQGREDLESIIRSAQNVAKLVNDLLEFSRLGKQELHVQRIDLTALVHRVINALPLNESDKPVRVDVDEGMVVSASENLLELVFTNLIENAYKYSKAGRELIIHVGKGPHDAFYVRDNGIGLDMAYATKIFLPFERLHGNLKIPGTGIGLANVRRIVELHGGQVWVESQEGVGSTFWVQLPAAPDESGVAQNAAIGV